MNTTLTRKEARRLIDNSFERIRIVLEREGASGLALDSVLQEKLLALKVIEAVRCCGGAATPRPTGTADVG